MPSLATPFRASRRIGFTSTIVLVGLWFGSVAIAARAATAVSFLWKIPALGIAVEGLLFVIGGIGGIVSFWLIADHIDYRRRGYRMRRTTGNEWLCEERVSETPARSLSCVRKIVGEGYPAPSEVRIISAASWDLQVPPWARGRRDDIVKRIAECFGGDLGADIRFLDL